MIFSQFDKIGFIHIPKTGGDSITKALRVALKNPVEFEFEYKHHPARWIKSSLLRSQFHTIKWLAVRRNPVDILRSYYAHTMYSYHNYPLANATDEWIEEMRQVSQMTFSEYVDYGLSKIDKGGFLKHYCCDYNGRQFNNITVIDFNDIEKGFLAFCTANKIDCTLTHENGSKGQKPNVGPILRDRIASYCYADAPPVIAPPSASISTL